MGWRCGSTKNPSCMAKRSRALLRCCSKLMGGLSVVSFATLAPQPLIEPPAPPEGKEKAKEGSEARTLPGGNIYKHGIEIKLTGTIAAQDSIDLSFPAGDRITSILVQAGDRVTGGYALARSDNVQQQQALRRAHAGRSSRCRQAASTSSTLIKSMHGGSG